MNITEYVEQAGITAEVIENHGIRRDSDGWEHRSAIVLLTNHDGGKLITPWRQGLGIDKHPAEQADAIVDSLISDVWSFQQARGFEDWAEEFGYDTDSRRAESVYRTIEELAPRVVEFLGGQENFEYVAMELDRL